PGGKTECNKLPCPAPACPKSQWVRSEENPCCLVCGDPPTTEAPVEEPQKDINMNGACNFLGEVKSNGDRWHPNIHPFGYMKCFFCECKDGEFHCGRLQCPVLSCVRRRKRPNVCCEECAADQPEEPRVKKKKDKQKGQMSKDCSFAGTPYKNGQRWRPNSSPAGSGECAVCKCTEGNVQCRLRCPRVCKEDMAKNPCCRHCP
ncbi:chordin, partial [Aplysia californica]|uniref:Chordin n=1 Tax=Aplysia californica TaxID=6500 RepID=A0ABM0KBB1_APLCA